MAFTCRSLGVGVLNGIKRVFICPGSQVSGSMAGSARGRRLLAGPVGSTLQLPGASGWFPWDSPLLFSGEAAVVPAVVLLGFLSSGGSLDVCGSDLLRICPGSRGAGLWLLTLTIAYLYGETLYTQALSHSDPQVFRFRC
ncbi:hypothetical protein ILYODFUR_035293 [Ilyodon furcidens]|uniref:Uncharacterized protein n=1 Tax=Ilyodon furcidens TaxID=33524 RepID=A0ABV0VJQ8_9TELE